MTLAMSGATPEDAGLASGLVNTTAQVGGALGLAILATVSTSRTDKLAAAGESAASALVGGYRVAYLIGAGLLLVAAIAAATVVQAEKKAEAQVAEAPHAHGVEPAWSEAA